MNRGVLFAAAFALGTGGGTFADIDWPGIRVEYDSDESWDLGMEPENPEFAGRRVLLPPEAAAGILRNLGQERALSMRASDAGSST